MLNKIGKQPPLMLKSAKITNTKYQAAAGPARAKPGPSEKPSETDKNNDAKFLTSPNREKVIKLCQKRKYKGVLNQPDQDLKCKGDFILVKDPKTDEYCCRTDYRMLIQEITEEHKKVFEDLEEKYKIKFAE